MMKAEAAGLGGVWVLQQDVHRDFRGPFTMLYSVRDFEAFARRYLSPMPPPYFVEDDCSASSRGVLRGIHCDSEAWKLISCLHGRIYLVIVDCDPASPTFQKWVAFTLEAGTGQQILVPPKHGVAHLVLSDSCVFHYKQSRFYDLKRQTTFQWNDPAFNIWWPIREPMLSERDGGRTLGPQV